MVYFKVSRQTGRDYIKYLLKVQFRPQRVERQIVQRVELEEADVLDVYRRPYDARYLAVQLMHGD